jgi:transcriptional regulator with XRE-family HTH domain
VDAKEIVGANIRRERERLDLSQEALADRAGTSVQQVSRAERGIRDLRVSTVAMLAAGLGVTAADLLDGV